ncbi:MAG: cysteine synthase family protein [Chitinivibrionales bacterium]|nr:cysteine synthase family protein [Chitinivibrionales bacterium]
MKQTIQQKIHHIAQLIGNTPLLKIYYSYKNEIRSIYAKAEHLSLTGSIKDRMALYIIKKAYESGHLKSGYTIAEATSGNTGIAFCSIGRSLGHPVEIFMPDWMSQERKNIMKGFGARITTVSQEMGGFLGSIRMCEELALQKQEVFLPRQFSNQLNTEAHYATTGAEIWWQLQNKNSIPDAFIAGVGSGGTIMGVGKYLKEKFPTIRVFPLEPSSSPILSRGCKSGSHRIQGISDEFIPPIVQLRQLDDIIGIDDGDAIVMAQKLAAQLGLGIGISSGANFIGAVKVQNMLGSDTNVVTIFPDDNKKYLSTDLFRDEPVKDSHLSKDIVCLHYETLKRLCHFCYAPQECPNGHSGKEECIKHGCIPEVRPM